jgi:hypothetical protein
MAMFILEDASGIGSDDLDPLQAFVDLVIIANDDGIGLNDPVNGMQQVTYNPTENGPPQLRLDALVNTAFTPDYGAGAQNVDTIVIAGLSGFVLDDGSSFANNGTALAPASSGLAGSALNTTENCLVIYDTQQNICVARDGTGGDIDLPISNPVLLYHEFSHAFRIVNNTLLALTFECDPASPEENAAIIDENDLRTQIAQRQGEAPVLRDPNIHCGQVGCDSGCCIIATVASRSLSSRQVQSLRAVRDHFVRSTEVGFAFFEQFFHDYYAFSPQVCKLMASDPRLPDEMLAGYVDPLLDFWRIMIERSRQQLNGQQMAKRFLALQPDDESVRRRLAAMDRIQQGWFDPAQPTGARVATALVTLLAERALPSEHVRWALLEPVLMMREWLLLSLEDAGSEGLAIEMEQAVAQWAAGFPISGVWAALSGGEVRRELRFCERVLMQSRSAFLRFHQRLRARFPDITALTRELDRLDAAAGGVA